MTNPSLAVMNPVTVELVYDNVPYRATFLREEAAMEWVAETLAELLGHLPMTMASDIRIRRLA